MFSSSPVAYPATRLNNSVLIQLPKYLTVVEAVALQSQCRQYLQNQPSIKRIILDFGQTLFVDSSGIGALVATLRLAKSQQIEFVLWSIQPEVKLIFSLLALDKIFAIETGTEPLQPMLEPKSSKQQRVTHASVQSTLKRAIDIIGALVGLSVTAIVFLPIVLAIVMDNPGPIFFRQIRCGLMGKRFYLWKFRSMVSNAEALKSQIANQVEGPMFKNANDPRITRVGKFLRKTSLDELLQFWNVLIGDMSLVGTRPPTPDELDRYETPSWQRLNVKPGMTGEWQVYGRSKVTKFEDVIALDLRYQDRWSLGYDFKLLLKTIQVLFTKNAGAF